MNPLRALLAAITALAAWLVTHVLVEKALALTAIAFCPEGFGSGGECYVDWWSYVSTGYIVSGVGLSAAMAIFAAVWVAKTHQRQVARATFYIGMLVATGIVVTTWFSWFVLGCWLSALLMGWFTVKRLDQKHTSTV